MDEGISEMIDLNLATARLTLPVHVFVEAVRLASVPRPPIADTDADEGYRHAEVQRRYAAVDHLTIWWNATAQPELRSAFGFMHYVKAPSANEIFWASGDREEGYVDEAAMASAGSKKGEAVVLDDIILMFFQRPITTAYGFSALNVDGSHGSKGGRPAWLNGDEIVATDAYDGLHDFPARFSNLWKRLQRHASCSLENTKTIKG